MCLQINAKHFKQLENMSKYFKHDAFKAVKKRGIYYNMSTSTSNCIVTLAIFGIISPFYLKTKNT